MSLLLSRISVAGPPQTLAAGVLTLTLTVPSANIATDARCVILCKQRHRRAFSRLSKWNQKRYIAKRGGMPR